MDGQQQHHPHRASITKIIQIIQETISQGVSHPSGKTISGSSNPRRSESKANNPTKNKPSQKIVVPLTLRAQSFSFTIVRIFLLLVRL